MTAQIPETLILDGKPRRMTFCPPLPPDIKALNHDVRIEYVKELDANRLTHHRVLALWTDADGDRHEEEEASIIFSTACWRQYVGTWEIKDGNFYLVEIRGRMRLAHKEPMLADWFTGVLRLPRGKELLYVHMGFGSVYEEELHIKIERGRVKGRRIFDNRKGEHDEAKLGWQNLPGSENHFPAIATSTEGFKEAWRRKAPRTADHKGREAEPGWN